MIPSYQPKLSKPQVFVTGDTTDDRAVIVDVSSRYIFAEVLPSRGMPAEALAECAIEEYRRATGVYPSAERTPPDATVTPFGTFVEHYSARIFLCEESARLLPHTAAQYHSPTAAMIAARHGQLLTYLQIVNTFTSLGRQGTDAIDVLNERIDSNDASESALLRASPLGTTLTGMRTLNVERAALQAAASVDLVEFPMNPQPLGEPGTHQNTARDTIRERGWAIAEKIAPWWTKHASSFLTEPAPQQTPALFECPGLSDTERRQAVEALNGLQYLQRSLTSVHGSKITLPDVVGYDQQWRGLFVLSLMSPNTLALAQASKASEPLALSMRRRFAEAQGQKAPQVARKREPVALPECVTSAGNRRSFRL